MDGWKAFRGKVERKSWLKIWGGKIFGSQNIQLFTKEERFSCPNSEEYFKKMAVQYCRLHPKRGNIFRAEEERFSCEGKMLYGKRR